MASALLSTWGKSCRRSADRLARLMVPAGRATSRILALPLSSLHHRQSGAQARLRRSSAARARRACMSGQRPSLERLPPRSLMSSGTQVADLRRALAGGWHSVAWLPQASREPLLSMKARWENRCLQDTRTLPARLIAQPLVATLISARSASVPGYCRSPPKSRLAGLCPAPSAAHCSAAYVRNALKCSRLTDRPVTAFESSGSSGTLPLAMRRPLAVCPTSRSRARRRARRPARDEVGAANASARVPGDRVYRPVGGSMIRGEGQAVIAQEFVFLLIAMLRRPAI